MKIFKDLSNGKNRVLNVKKQINNGMGLPLHRMDENKQSQLNKQHILQIEAITCRFLPANVSS
jgi:hypothetical protein